MIKRELVSYCALGVAAIALSTSPARAASVSASVSTVVFDSNSTLPNPDTQSCSSSTACITTPDASTTGPETSATSGASVNLQPATISSISNLVSVNPNIVLGGEERSSGSGTVAGISGTAQWSFGSVVATTSAGNTNVNNATITGGALNWVTPFSMVNSNAPAVIQFQWTVSGETITDTPISIVDSVSLSCNGATCTSGNAVGFVEVNLATGVIDNFFNLFGSISDLSVSEMVSYNSSINSGDLLFSLEDPMTLTYLDPSGNTVANLVLYDQSLNGVIGLSGQDFSGSETPIPSALPLFATGLGVLGLLGWRRKRNFAAVVVA